MDTLREDGLDDGIFTAYVVIDAALRAGRFHLVDQLLGCVDAESAPLELVLAYLSITHAARELLFSRWGFFKRVRNRLVRAYGAQATADLLRGQA